MEWWSHGVVESWSGGVIGLLLQPLYLTTPLLRYFTTNKALNLLVTPWAGYTNN
ncbi:MAG: hypothetical protein HC764_10620 [Pleurocapsa sp. CRU_1_2]|nr:hypothetical protein [Pleurocapsa sp. CRU_1_2]